MFVAGIDGGGTHTRLELRDEGNNLIRRSQFGPFNITSIGEEAFSALLREVFDSCGGLCECEKLCIGGAGISNPRMKPLLEQQLEQAGFQGKWKLCGDQEIALRGAMDTPGAVLIAGTGSICFGRNAAGQSTRSGGYGHLIDDGGSGYALGRDVLAAAVRSIDGRSQDTAILGAVYNRLNVHTPQELVSFVYGSKTDKAAIAKLARIALELAEAGNPVALEILSRGAEELAALVRAVQEKLELTGCPVALLGGLLGNDTCYRRIVVQHLESIAQPVHPLHDALWGAAQLAWEL